MFLFHIAVKYDAWLYVAVVVEQLACCISYEIGVRFQLESIESNSITGWIKYIIIYLAYTCIYYVCLLFISRSTQSGESSGLFMN